MDLALIWMINTKGSQLSGLLMMHLLIISTSLLSHLKGTNHSIAYLLLTKKLLLFNDKCIFII